MIVADEGEEFREDLRILRFGEREQAERVAAVVRHRRIVDDLVGRQGVVGADQVFELEAQDRAKTVDHLIAQRRIGDARLDVVAEARAGGPPQVVAQDPGGAIGAAGGARVVAAELDGDPVGERELVPEHRFAARFQRIQLRDEVLEREGLVIDRHRDQRTNPVGHLGDDAEQAVARPHLLHQLRLRLGDLEEIAVRQHELDADDIGSDLAVFAGERSVLRAGAGRAAGGQAADLGVDVELQIARLRARAPCRCAARPPRP